MDDLDLLHDPEDPARPRRPPWMLLGGIMAVALLALVGVVWMVGTAVDGGDRPAAAASTGPTSTSVSASPTPDPTPAAVPSAATVVAAPTTAPPAVAPRAATPGPTVRTTTPGPVPRPTATTRSGLVRVPDIIGQRVRAATATLRAAGFQVAVLGGFSRPDRDERRVIAQRPTPGSWVPAGSLVVLIIDRI